MDSEPVSDEKLCQLDEEAARASDTVLVKASTLARLLFDLYTERQKVEDLESDAAIRDREKASNPIIVVCQEAPSVFKEKFREATLIPTKPLLLRSFKKREPGEGR